MKKLLLEHKGKFILYVIACFLPVISQLMQIGVVALIFETIERNTMQFFWIALGLSVLYLILNAVLFIISRMMRIAYMRDVLLSLREKAFDKIIHMSYKQFNKQSRDVYVSNLINDINTFESSFFLSLINFIFRCGLYVSVLVILAFLNWVIALIILGVSVMVLFISKLFEKKTVSLQKDVSTSNEKFTVNISNIFTGLEILKLNNIEDIFLKKNKTQILDLEGKKFKFNVFTALQMYSNITIGYFVLMGLLIYLMYQIKTGIGYGQLVLIVQLSSSAIFPLVNMLPLVNVLKSSKAIFEKITNSDEQVKEEDNLLPFHFQNSINLNQVSFAYDASNPIFKSIKFSLEKGKKHLIKGPSGSGKTTLFKLLSHILDDYDGVIDVDGINMNQISSKSFNEKVSYVYQDVFLFEASLKDNISLFKSNSDEEVLQACKKAGLSEFIDSLENGIHTVISENGKNLSGGERQRVSIARALCKKAEILFVDEATSALNDELGRQIEQTLLDLDATVISISHKYFDGITNLYDVVLEIKDGYMSKYSAKEYFAGANL
ncbi:MAG: ABC transporter ATP-binding protein/permease [Firmicutes bacterium]|nr:ABC transporter ATP-binding protein/permease [Bacillota bacterium]